MCLVVYTEFLIGLWICPEDKDKLFITEALAVIII